MGSRASEERKMPSSVREAISRIVDGKSLSSFEAAEAMSEIMSGLASQSQIAAFLTALRIKGETAEELASFAEIMRAHALKIEPRTASRLVDTCGTGGDRLKTFNVSTTAALVVAGAGLPVAKHGNRSFTSRCGSADILEELGVNINAEPLVVQTSIENAGIGFIFAPMFHPAMKHASIPRKEIGIRTVFNVLGPLTNPAGAKVQLVGVYADHLVLTVAQALRKLGVEDAIVVHGLDGLDEVSLIGKTHAAIVDGEKEEIREDILTPSSFGLSARNYEEVSASESIEEQAKTAIRILDGRSNGALSNRDKAVKEMVLVNAAAAIVAARKAESYLEAMEMASSSLDSGRALEKLDLLVKYSGGDASRMESLSLETLGRE